MKSIAKTITAIFILFLTVESTFAQCYDPNEIREEIGFLDETNTVVFGAIPIIGNEYQLFPCTYTYIKRVYFPATTEACRVDMEYDPLLYSHYGDNFAGSNNGCDVPGNCYVTLNDPSSDLYWDFEIEVGCGVSGTPEWEIDYTFDSCNNDPVIGCIANISINSPFFADPQPSECFDVQLADEINIEPENTAGILAHQNYLYYKNPNYEFERQTIIGFSGEFEREIHSLKVDYNPEGELCLNNVQFQHVSYGPAPNFIPTTLQTFNFPMTTCSGFQEFTLDFLDQNNVPFANGDSILIVENFTIVQVSDQVDFSGEAITTFRFRPCTELSCLDLYNKIFERDIVVKDPERMVWVSHQAAANYLRTTMDFVTDAFNGQEVEQATLDVCGNIGADIVFTYTNRYKNNFLIQSQYKKLGMLTMPIDIEGLGIGDYNGPDGFQIFNDKIYLRVWDSNCQYFQDLNQTPNLGVITEMNNCLTGGGFIDIPINSYNVIHTYDPANAPGYDVNATEAYIGRNIVIDMETLIPALLADGYILDSQFDSFYNDSEFNDFKPGGRFQIIFKDITVDLETAQLKYKNGVDAGLLSDSNNGSVTNFLFAGKPNDSIYISDVNSIYKDMSDMLYFESCPFVASIGHLNSCPDAALTPTSSLNPFIRRQGKNYFAKNLDFDSFAESSNYEVLDPSTPVSFDFYYDYQLDNRSRTPWAFSAPGPNYFFECDNLGYKAVFKFPTEMISDFINLTDLSLTYDDVEFTTLPCPSNPCDYASSAELTNNNFLDFLDSCPDCPLSPDDPPCIDCPVVWVDNAGSTELHVNLEGLEYDPNVLLDIYNDCLNTPGTANCGNAGIINSLYPLYLQRMFKLDFTYVCQGDEDGDGILGVYVATDIGMEILSTCGDCSADDWFSDDVPAINLGGSDHPVTFRCGPCGSGPSATNFNAIPDVPYNIVRSTFGWDESTVNCDEPGCPNPCGYFVDCPDDTETPFVGTFSHESMLTTDNQFDENNCDGCNLSRVYPGDKITIDIGGSFGTGSLYGTWIEYPDPGIAGLPNIFDNSTNAFGNEFNVLYECLNCDNNDIFEDLSPEFANTCSSGYFSLTCPDLADPDCNGSQFLFIPFPQNVLDIIDNNIGQSATNFKISVVLDLADDFGVQFNTHYLPMVTGGFAAYDNSSIIQNEMVDCSQLEASCDFFSDNLRLINSWVTTRNQYLRSTGVDMCHYITRSYFETHGGLEDYDPFPNEFRPVLSFKNDELPSLTLNNGFSFNPDLAVDQLLVMSSGTTARIIDPESLFGQGFVHLACANGDCFDGEELKYAGPVNVLTNYYDVDDPPVEFEIPIHELDESGPVSVRFSSIIKSECAFSGGSDETYTDATQETIFPDALESHQRYIDKRYLQDVPVVTNVETSWDLKEHPISLDIVDNDLMPILTSSSGTFGGIFLDYNDVWAIERPTTAILSPNIWIDPYSLIADPQNSAILYNNQNVDENNPEGNINVTGMRIKFVNCGIPGDVEGVLDSDNGIFFFNFEGRNRGLCPSSLYELEIDYDLIPCDIGEEYNIIQELGMYWGFMCSSDEQDECILGPESNSTHWNSNWISDVAYKFYGSYEVQLGMAQFEASLLQTSFSACNTEFKMQLFNYDGEATSEVENINLNFDYELAGFTGGLDIVDLQLVNINSDQEYPSCNSFAPFTLGSSNFNLTDLVDQFYCQDGLLPDYRIELTFKITGSCELFNLQEQLNLMVDITAENLCGGPEDQSGIQGSYEVVISNTDDCDLCSDLGIDEIDNGDCTFQFEVLDNCFDVINDVIPNFVWILDGVELSDQSNPITIDLGANNQDMHDLEFVLTLADGTTICTQEVMFSCATDCSCDGSGSDDVAPVFDGNPPATTNVDCEDIDSPVYLTAMDNCTAVVNVTYQDFGFSGGCLGAVERIWTATDDCGNSDTYTQILFIVDETIPELIGVPDDVTYNSIDDVPTPPTVTATDNCDESLDVIYDEQISDNCPENYTIVRTWSVIDHCNNEAIETQVITVICTDISCECVPETGDTEPPIFIDQFPALDDINCEDLDSPVFPIVEDNCTDMVNVTYEDLNFSGPCLGAVQRTWSATDICGNIATYTQILNIIDVTIPVLSGVPSDATYDDINDVPDPPIVTVTDNCDEDVIVIFSEQINDNCPDDFTIIRTWSSIDHCNNEVSQSQTITVVCSDQCECTGPNADVNPPSWDGIIDEKVITIECDQFDDIMITVSDDCTEIVQLTYWDEPIDGPCPDSFNRHWTATDDCGNSEVYIQGVYLVDTTQPVWIGIDDEDEITADCEDLSNVTITVEDNCSPDVNLTYYDQLFSGGCLGTIDRIWTATDNCGNSSTFQQIITITDDTNPVLVGVPLDANYSTINDVPDPPIVTVSDNCDDNVIVNFEEIEIDNCPTEHTIVRTWSAIDVCNNEVIQSQTITIDCPGECECIGPNADVTTPTWDEIIDEKVITIECDQFDDIMITVSDNCTENVQLTFWDEPIDGPCPDSFNRHWTATDDCGNFEVFVQGVYLVDSTPPVWIGIDEEISITVECDELNNSTVTVEDNCSPDVNLSYYDQPFSGGCLGSVERFWTAVDLCGNTSNFSQIIYIEDNTAPNLVGIPPNATYPTANDVPSPPLVTANDNCDENVVVQYTELINNNCPDEYVIVRTWTAMDVCGNQTSASQIITIDCIGSSKPFCFVQPDQESSFLSGDVNIGNDVLARNTGYMISGDLAYLGQNKRMYTGKFSYGDFNSNWRSLANLEYEEEGNYNNYRLMSMKENVLGLGGFSYSEQGLYKTVMSIQTDNGDLISLKEYKDITPEYFGSIQSYDFSSRLDNKKILYPVVGKTYNDDINPDIFVMLVDPFNDYYLSKRYGGLKNDQIAKTVLTYGKEVIVFGETTTNNGEGPLDLILMKLDSELNQILTERVYSSDKCANLKAYVETVNDADWSGEVAYFTGSVINKNNIETAYVSCVNPETLEIVKTHTLAIEGFQTRGLKIRMVKDVGLYIVGDAFNEEFSQGFVALVSVDGPCETNLQWIKITQSQEFPGAEYSLNGIDVGNENLILTGRFMENRFDPELESELVVITSDIEGKNSCCLKSIEAQYKVFEFCRKEISLKDIDLKISIYNSPNGVETVDPESICEVKKTNDFPFDFTQNEMVEVYPNPTRDIFNVYYKSETDNIGSVEIIALEGSRLFIEKYAKMDAVKKLTIDLSMFAGGMYILELKTTNGETIRKNVTIIK